MRSMFVQMMQYCFWISRALADRERGGCHEDRWDTEKLIMMSGSIKACIYADGVQRHHALEILSVSGALLWEYIET